MAGRKRAEDYSVYSKPKFTDIVKTNKNYKTALQGAMMYAHYELSDIDMKRETIKYLKILNSKHPILEKIKDVNERRFSTVGKYAYVANNGGQIPDDISAKWIPFLEKIIAEEEIRISNKSKATGTAPAEEIEVDAEISKVVISIQDRLRDKAREIAGELEGWIDDFYLSRKTASPKSVNDFVSFFKANELKAPHMRYMRIAFEKRTAEIEEAAEGKNKDLTEGYSNFTKPELKRFATFHRNILSACDMMQEVAKVERAPRKKKPVSQEKLVSKLKYKKEDAGLGIVSLNPVHIVGAKEVWTYNTKTRKLAHYKATDERGLTVKGASLENYSAESAEKTLRKPVEQLAEFKKTSKVKLRTFLKDLSTVDIPAGGKLNENHIILRIDT